MCELICAYFMSVCGSLLGEFRSSFFLLYSPPFIHPRKVIKLKVLSGRHDKRIFFFLNSVTKLARERAFFRDPVRKKSLFWNIILLYPVIFLFVKSSRQCKLTHDSKNLDCFVHSFISKCSIVVERKKFS